MSEHTPAPEQMRNYYASGLDDLTPEQSVAFDRWLAQHDAEVAAKALREAADQFVRDWTEVALGGAGYVAETLRARAEAVTS